MDLPKIDNFNDIRHMFGGSKTPDGLAIEQLNDEDLAKFVKHLSRRADTLLRLQNEVPDDRKQEQERQYGEFGDAIVARLKASKGRYVIWDVLDSYMNSNPDTFGKRYESRFDEWHEQALNDPNIGYKEVDGVESWAWQPVDSVDNRKTTPRDTAPMSASTAEYQPEAVETKLTDWGLWTKTYNEGNKAPRSTLSIGAETLDMHETHVAVIEILAQQSTPISFVDLCKKVAERTGVEYSPATGDAQAKLAKNKVQSIVGGALKDFRSKLEARDLGGKLIQEDAVHYTRSGRKRKRKTYQLSGVLTDSVD